MLDPLEAVHLGDDRDVHGTADGFFRRADVPLQIGEGHQAFGHIRHVRHVETVNGIQDSVDEIVPLIV